MPAPRTAMFTLRFEARISIRGVNPYVTVSAARAQKLKKGWRRPMPVLVRVNGKPEQWWRINLMPAGDGSFYLYLHGDVREASGTGVGKLVALEVRFDEAYRNGPMHTMPRRFRSALSANSRAKQGWQALSPSRQKEILRYLASLKSDEARARNIDRAIAMLEGQEGRYMGRTWKGGK
jgi:hypothetical protein